MLHFYLTILKKLSSIGKKILLVIIVYGLVISLFGYFINKDKPKISDDPIKKSRNEIYQIINDPELNKTKEGRLSIAIFRIAICKITGDACTKKDEDGEKNRKNSLIGVMSNLISTPFTNPPASGVYWAYSGLQSVGFIPKAYAAQGFGFTAIQPFAKIWIIFRNLSYMVIVILLISIGFMIMFRMKINPQTVISIENALPRLVITLLLITFSFPIAGFLIDLMYLLIALIISQYTTLNINLLSTTNATSLLNDYATGGFWNIFPLNFNLFDIGNAMLNILPKDINNIVRTFFGFIGTIGFVKLMQFWYVRLGGALRGVGVEAATFGFNLGNIPDLAVLLIDVFIFVLSFNFMGPILISIIIFFTVLLLLFRVFFNLLTTYIQILLLIIFAPVILLIEAVPGKNAFSYWFKNLIVNILVFPLVVLLILTGYLISQINLDYGKEAWAPPFLYGIDPQAFATIVGLGIVLMIPDFIKMTKEMLGAKGLPLGLSLGTFFSGVGAAWSGTQMGIGTASSLTQMPFIGYKILQSKKGQKIFGKPIGVQLAETMDEIIEKRQAGGGGGGNNS